ncbi:hypothetical protein LX83_005141 [Goodfellowiella coeruleoviolacea]|uniref:Uncharacterized protein n=2 Tax=Goodfellowiella coeruleoviolacea TaxID=334858 RepID=A0AAE3KN30_9PSEU|nr:hypothetical protein [Goodfellowiella coeruleoviolacea]
MNAVGMRTDTPEAAPAPLAAPLELAERLTGVTADRALVLDAAWPAGFVRLRRRRPGGQQGAGINQMQG